MFKIEAGNGEPASREELQWFDVSCEYLEDSDIFRLWQFAPGENILSDDAQQICLNRDSIDKLINALYYLKTVRWENDNMVSDQFDAMKDYKE